MHRETADEIQDIAREPDSQRSSLEGAPSPASDWYQQHRGERLIEEPKSGGCLCGCFIWMVSLLGIGALVLVVLFSLDVVSTRVKPCSLDSPGIPTPGQIAAVGDLFRDECVRVSGTVVFQDADELVVEMNRGEYVQRVNVRDPSEVFEAISLGPRRDPGWAAQSGGGRGIRSPLHTGPWIGPGVVAEPPGEHPRVVLGRCGRVSKRERVPVDLAGRAWTDDFGSCSDTLSTPTPCMLISRQQ